MHAFLTLIFAAFIMMAPMAALAQTDADDAKRLELAEKMHEIRPVQPQIEDTIRSVSMRIPEDRREIFVTKMLDAFDKDTLNEISIRSMADTFTVAELEAMIGYFGSEEGRSVGEKMPVYWGLVRPEISKLIDKAMMDVRLGPAGQ